MYRKLTVNIGRGRKRLVGFLASPSNNNVEYQLVFHKYASSLSSLEAKPRKISNNISFRAAFDSPLDLGKRPIVLLYGWLVAKARHIHKHGDFYLSKGFDVVHIKIKPDQFLRPVQGQKVVEQVLEFVSEGDRAKQPILQHGFSVGAYLYAETLVKIQDNPEAFDSVGRRIRGQILDSPVEFYRVPYGVSRAVTKVPVLQNLIEASLNSYLRAMYNSTTRHYIRAQEVFLEHQYSVPTLYMYSHADIIADPVAIENNEHILQERGIHVETECFDGSSHVCHFHQHPVQYITGVQRFLGNIGLLQQETVENEKLRV